MDGSIDTAALAGCSGETPDASEGTGVGAALDNDSTTVPATAHPRQRGER